MTDNLHYIFLAIVAVLTGLFFYDSYFVDHSIHYSQCGGAVPVSVPFAVHKKGEELVCDFSVEEERVYILQLRYFHHNNSVDEYEQMIEIVGGKNRGSPTAEGGPMVVEFEVKSLDTGKVIKKGQGDSFKIYSGIIPNANAKVTGLQLETGHYQFTIKSLKDVPEMKDIRTEISVMFSGGKG